MCGFELHSYHQYIFTEILFLGNSRLLRFSVHFSPRSIFSEFLARAATLLVSEPHSRPRPLEPAVEGRGRARRKPREEEKVVVDAVAGVFDLVHGTRVPGSRYKLQELNSGI